MKKHSVNKLPVPSIHSIIATQKLHETGRRAKTSPITTTAASVVPPPDEETLLMLNKIAKESPFCFYYKGRSNDVL